MKITENTLVPISLVISLVGGMGAVTYGLFQVTAQGKQIEEIQKKQDSFSSVQVDIAVIKNDVAQIKRMMEEK